MVRENLERIKKGCEVVNSLLVGSDCIWVGINERNADTNRAALDTNNNLMINSKFGINLCCLIHFEGEERSEMGRPLRNVPDVHTPKKENIGISRSMSVGINFARRVFSLSLSRPDCFYNMLHYVKRNRK